MPEKEGNFTGWVEVSEMPRISEEQRDRLAGLERVVVENNHAETAIGDVSLLFPLTSNPKERIKTGDLLQYVKDIASENGVSPWEVVQELRSYGITDAKELFDVEKRYKERIVYVSDVHEGTDALYASLEKLIEEPPSQVIFVGDVIGTEEFVEHQNLFYGGLINHAKPFLANEYPSDEALLQYGGTNTSDGFTLKAGFLALRTKELEHAGYTSDQITNQLDSLTDDEIAGEIRRYSKYEHYGHYTSNLPDEVKHSLASGLETNAQKLVSVIHAMQQAGSEVHIVEGNWDANSPIDFVPGADVDIAIPVSPSDRLFNPETFFTKNDIPYHTGLTAVETETSLQVLLPYLTLKEFDSLPDEEKQSLLDRVKQARSQKKSVIVTAHGEPSWEMHALTNPSSKAGKEHAQVIHGLGRLLNLIHPDELVYGHMHKPFVDRDGSSKDENVKYALTLRDSNTLSIETDPAAFSDESVVVSYLPWRKIAETNISLKDKNRKPRGFGGNRQPVMIRK